MVNYRETKPASDKEHAINSRERQMLDLLKRGRDEHGYVAVKAEFEAEGTRTDELLRLLEMTRRAGLKMALKIGGCEAVRDLIESRQFGVDYVIAPMIESPYALSKYIQAKDKIYRAEEREDTRFLFNVETEAAFRVLPELVELARTGSGVDGIVFGRVDFCGSRGLSSDEINRPEVTACCVEAAKRCRDAGLEYVVGGGVSKDALEVLREVRQTYLSRFETRKVIFDAGCLPAASQGVGAAPVADGLLAAVRFEILWLLNKRDYYKEIGAEDDRRIAMLEARWKVLNGDGRA